MWRYYVSPLFDSQSYDKKREKMIDLGRKISDLTLKGLFWGKNGANDLEKERIKFSKNNASHWFDYPEFLSAGSSTYYAGGGNAGSRAKASNLFLKPFWYWRGWRCLRVAERLSDKFARLKPMEDMSLGELDVRACILNKAKRRNEATAILSHGIMKILTKQIGTKHDLCLFLIHEAEIIAGMKTYDKENKAEKNYQQAMKLTEDETVPILTKVRVMKSYGKFLIQIDRNEAKHLLNRACRLAEENGRFDQAVKIKALLASVK